MSDQAPIRVLIAEDDPETRELYSNLLSSLGHEVVAAAATGREAVDLAREHRPDVVLLDVHMPDMTGVEAARAIAAEQPDVAIVLVTGDHELSLTDEELDASGARTLLGKPVQAKQLDSALRLAVRKARVEAQLRREVADVRQTLEARKLIERAKGILMRRTGSSEQEAYRILQRTSQDKSMPMVDVAKAVINSEPGAHNGARPAPPPPPPAA
ncbi:response regulator [Roseisolibacter sp. H3M3-2]|uniref:ANTAR domain-containing response regulator n=1 Tax=Roseisolibacter sp. H3M3-2 TaxID=3031323 RepID=UPI0023DA288E|nr:response regulator [Roseisolibacter sp. H3M3-2]MDF1504545.1 response regulator [Roseisolibacter sp. H3M3-2]